MITLADNHLTGRQTTFYYYVVLEFRSQFDEAALNRRVASYHEDVSSSLFDDQCLLRYYRSIFPYIQQQFYLGKLSREQHMFRVGEFSTYREGSGFRIYLRCRKVNQTLIFIDAVVRQCNGYRRLPGTDSPDSAPQSHGVFPDRPTCRSGGSSTTARIPAHREPHRFSYFPIH